jgi:fumarate hydratase class I
MDDLTEHFAELIRRTSTDLPADVEKRLKEAREREEPNSAAQGAFDTILKNIGMSRRTFRPICQDTGTPIFYVWYPEGWSQRKLREQITRAVQISTEKSYLRPNAVEAISGKNSGDNTGVDFPTIHFEEWEHDTLRVGLMLKGGGCENVGRQYSLPSSEFPASRDMQGVRKAVLDAVYQAQGEGCAPGVLGVAIGGDRATSVIKAKEQFFRPLEDNNADPELDKVEKQLYDEANQLGIGPMGFGGNTTVLGVKMAQMHRLPASFFVSVSYMCWADRRKVMTYHPADKRVVIE